ncbi:MAG TPA: beta-N-acetylhexosaminidase [Elusimicrobia bacterium]|nr:beta-N-acetylhexosaminidase [Elusimicrobiota bacterium]
MGLFLAQTAEKWDQGLEELRDGHATRDHTKFDIFTGMNPAPRPDPGFLFMLGIYGRRPTRESVSLLRETNASGVLLLARNIESPAQVRDLTRGLVDAVGRPILFAVDHEGGWVLRFASGVTAFPGNAALGRARDPKLAYATGRQMALELSPLGIGMNLAPVVDVHAARYNPGIGIRSFGSDPALVGRLGSAFLRGLQDHGVAACAKHFPGKGAATVDAHVALPTIRLPRREFFATHLTPFAAAARAGVAAVMTTHVRCPAFDRKPASFSRRITHDLIRSRLGFDGAVISDDLCMGAVTTRGPVPAAALDAFRAGHDVIMIAHDPGAQREAVELFRAAHADGELPADELAQSCRRIKKLLSYARRRRAAANPAAGARLALQVARKAATVARRGTIPLPLPDGARRTLVLLPNFPEVRERFTFEDGPNGPGAFMRRAFIERGRYRLMFTPVESPQAGPWREAIRAADHVVFFCFEAMRFAGQRAVLDFINRQAPDRAVACLIRSSFDLGLLDPRITVIDACGYRLCQLQAAGELIFGRRP